MIPILNNIPTLTDSFGDYRLKSSLLLEDLHSVNKGISVLKLIPDYMNLSLGSTTNITVPTNVTKARVYLFGKGADATTSVGGGGGGCAYGDIDVIPNSTILISGNTNITLSVSDEILMTANAASGNNGGSATIVTQKVFNGSAFSGGQAGSFGGGASGSPLGAGGTGGITTQHGGTWGSSAPTAQNPNGLGARYEMWNRLTDPLLFHCVASVGLGAGAAAGNVYYTSGFGCGGYGDSSVTGSLSNLYCRGGFGGGGGSCSGVGGTSLAAGGGGRGTTSGGVGGPACAIIYWI